MARARRRLGILGLLGGLALVACAVGASLLDRGVSAPPGEPPGKASEVVPAGPDALSPGWGELGFAPPTPGSYELHELGFATDGEVLQTDGKALRLHGLLGERVTILSFIYTTCGNTNGCPLAMVVLNKVKTRLEGEPALAEQVRLISLSFDPAQDTPSVMGRYARRHGGGTVPWEFLTTRSEEELRPLLEGYGQNIVREVDGEGKELGSIAHALRVYVIDRHKRIRNIYSSSLLHADLVINDIKSLLLEEEEQRASGEEPPGGGGAGEEGLSRPGDFKEGYERADYESRSRSLTERKGEAIALLARVRKTLLGLPPLPVPRENPLTEEKVLLGRKLFYDRRLSANGTLSCAMCHVPEQGFTHNEMATAVGIEGRAVRRNTPTLYNVAYLERLFHDGREYSLENQVWGPLLARNEMGNVSVGAVVEKLSRLKDYEGLFEQAFGRGPGMETVGMALASYERVLVSGGSAFDRWRHGGEADALGAKARRGFELFVGKAGCSACHTVGERFALFTDSGLHNTGVGYLASMGRGMGRRKLVIAPGVELEVEEDAVGLPSTGQGDLGLYEVTQAPGDRWKYRTPSLRNVALTAPYMHDGSLKTLEDVVRFYDQGGVANETLDGRVRPLGLSEAEGEALVAFLESLTGEDVDALVADAFAAPIGDD